MRKHVCSILLVSSLTLARSPHQPTRFWSLPCRSGLVEIAGGTGKTPLEPFVRLREGDKLSLAQPAHN